MASGSVFIIKNPLVLFVSAGLKEVPAILFSNRIVFQTKNTYFHKYFFKREIK